MTTNPIDDTEPVRRLRIMESRMSGLYERDALAWAEQQAALLDRMAAGERLNEAVDWPNVIEEVRDVGLVPLHAG